MALELMSLDGCDAPTTGRFSFLGRINDNGRALRGESAVRRTGIKRCVIEPGKPVQNAFIEASAGGSATSA